MRIEIIILLALALFFSYTAYANGEGGMTIIQTPAGPVYFCTEVSPGIIVCN